jgi:large subunit ribosomal protein L16
MAVIPKKLNFRLYFRNKTKTRKIRSRYFRLGRLLKKHFTRVISGLNDQKSLFEKTSFGSAATKKFRQFYYKNNTQRRVPAFCPDFWQIMRRKPEHYCRGINAKLTHFENNTNYLYNALKPDNIFLKKKKDFEFTTNRLLFGPYGICFAQYGTINAKFVDTANLDIAKILRKKGRIWTRVCCDTPVTERPVESRMGKGKGSISYWVAKVQPGQLFFEFSGISLEQLKEIYKKLSQKSGINLKIIY